MWIFAKHGFASATASSVDPEQMQVRFRVLEHLEAFRKNYGLKGETVHTRGTDYPCRVITTSENWIRVAAAIAAESGNYGNFKSAAGGNGQKSVNRYTNALHDVWEIMGHCQLKVEGFGPYGRKSLEPFRTFEEYLGALTPDQPEIECYDDDLEPEPIESDSPEWCDYCLSESDFTAHAGGQQFHVCSRCAEEFMNIQIQ